MLNFIKKLKIGAKIQIAIFMNVVLAILIGEYVIVRAINLTGSLGIVVNLGSTGTGVVICRF